MPRRSRGGVSTTGGMGSSSNIQDINEDNQSPTKLYLGNLPRTGKSHYCVDILAWLLTSISNKD